MRFKLLLLILVLVLAFGCCVQSTKTSPTWSSIETTTTTIAHGPPTPATVTTPLSHTLLPHISPTIAVTHEPYEYDSITDLNYLAEWGLKAKQFTRTMLDHGTVYVEFDELAGLKGYYGRYLAYVYLENGTDFKFDLYRNHDLNFHEAYSNGS